MIVSFHLNDIIPSASVEVYINGVLSGFKLLIVNCWTWKAGPKKPLLLFFLSFCKNP